MITERRKLRQVLLEILENSKSQGDLLADELSDAALAIFDETRPIKSAFRDAALHGIDLDGYPEELAEVLLAVCQMWYLHPPRSKSDKAYWIDDTRRLNDACGEFGIEAIIELRKDFETYMDTHNGLAPFTVEGPGALVRSARARAGLLRQRVEQQPRVIVANDGGVYV